VTFADGIYRLEAVTVVIRTYFVGSSSGTKICTALFQQIEQLDYEYNQREALYRLIYYSKSALHVSGDVFAHH